MAHKIRYLGNFDINADGKFLWEILAQLRELGRGRIVTKNEWLRKWPRQPSYLKIIKAQPEMDRWLMRGKLWGDWTFRGHNLGIYEFTNSLDRADWRLIHKHEEDEFTKFYSKMEPIEFPASMPLPPLLRAKFEKGEIVGMDDRRIGMDLCLDPQFEIIRSLFRKVDCTHNRTIYDEANREAWLDLYGDELPTKVEAWGCGPAELSFRFQSNIPAEEPAELKGMEVPQTDFILEDNIEKKDAPDLHPN